MRQKPLLALLGVLNVLFLVLAFFFFTTRNWERAERRSLEALTDRLAGELADVNGRLDVATIEMSQMQDKLKNALFEREELASQLKDRDESIRQMKREIAELRVQLNPVDLGKVMVQGGGGGLVAGAPRRLKPPPLAAADAAQAPSGGNGKGPVLEGKVVSINEEFDFVIIDLGTQNGIREGMSLMLYQDGAMAANLRVDMVDQTICAAAVVSHFGREIRPGDAVKTL